MPYPLDFKDCLLRRILFRWAIRFTSYEQIQYELVEKTIRETLEEFPEAADDSTIDVQLLATMRRLALEEFGIQFDDHDAPTLSEQSSKMSEDQ